MGRLFILVYSIHICIHIRQVECHFFLSISRTKTRLFHLSRSLLSRCLIVFLHAMGLTCAPLLP